MFWSTKPLVENPYVCKIMPEGCYSLLWKCHFVDNMSLPTVSNPAEKLFPKVYVPEEYIAVDESLMLWKDRLAMKQYIPMKRAWFGLKSHELCESSSGYIWNAVVHARTAMQLDNSLDGLHHHESY